MVWVLASIIHLSWRYYRYSTFDELGITMTCVGQSKRDYSSNLHVMETVSITIVRSFDIEKIGSSNVIFRP